MLVIINLEFVSAKADFTLHFNNEPIVGTPELLVSEIAVKRFVDI
jgi:hypothetical protein